jgi:S1-C subfamily serine protease
MTMYKLLSNLLILAVLIIVPETNAADSFDDYKQQARAEKEKQVESLFERIAPAIVTVRFVVTQEFMGQKSESESEVSGALVGEDGLVVVANSSLDPMGGMETMVLGGPPGMDLPAPKNKTSRYRILLADGSTESEAQLVARDSELDLAWFQIENTTGGSFPHLDFENSGTLEVGDSFDAVIRLPERFQRAAILQRGK